METPFDVEDEVRRRFEVKNSYQLPEGNVEFGVVYGPETGSRFAELFSVLATHGLVPQLTGDAEDCALTVRKDEKPAPKSSRIPIVLALLTMVTVVAFSLLQQLLYVALVPGLAGSVVLLTFALLLVGVLGSHELARRLASRGGRSGSSSQYLIPGVPFLPPFLPSLGYVSTYGRPAVNRDALFDAVLAGPLAVVVVAAAMYAVGILTSFPSTVTLAASHIGNSTVFVNSNAVQLGLDAALGGLAPKAAVGYILLSPLGDIATIGFILGFVMLLPLAAYDGGHLATLVLGQNRARAATYLSVLLLLVLDTPNYWALAVVALVVAGRPVQPRLLDEVTPVSKSKRWLLLGAVVIALLCVPLPVNVASIPLG